MTGRSGSSQGRGRHSSQPASRKVNSSPPAPEDRQQVAPVAQKGNNTKKPLEYKHPELSFLAEHAIYPFYDFLAQFLPLWVKPNHITLFGIACTVLSSILCFSCFAAETSRFERPFSLNPFPDAPAQVNFDGPHGVLAAVIRSIFGEAAASAGSVNFLLVAAGVLNLIYTIADNMDGRQARQTKQTSFIGEYLDHGLDCVTALMTTYLLALWLGTTHIGALWSAVAVATVTCASHLLHFTDNIFIWGNRFVSIDEAMVIFGAAPILRGLTGRPILDFTISVGSYTLEGHDIVLVGFLSTQVTSLISILSKSVRNLWSPIFISILLCNSAFLFFAATHEQETGRNWADAIAFPYPVLWAIAYAFCGSIICHIPLASQCARDSTADYWPLSIVFFAALSFAAAPVAGMIVAVSGHVLQILVNVTYIQQQRALCASTMHP
jgi:phosphatidylglycerophosphate synthase